MDFDTNISSGYGEIVKMIQKKKARIQSAHPVLRQNVTLRKMHSNLSPSFTYSKRDKSSRPASSVKINMSDYLTKIIDMAKKKQYPSSKEDIKKLTEIRERYVKGRLTDTYHVDEIRAIIKKILDKIANKDT